MSVEMLVRRADKINKKSEQLNAMCTKRGDVIVVKETPCVWSQREINDPNYVIVRVDMTIGDAESFLQEEEPITSREAQPLLKKRIKSLDLIELTKLIKSEEKQHDKANWVFIFNHSITDIVSNEKIKEPAPEVLV